jgi:hypothetical protein
MLRRAVLPLSLLLVTKRTRAQASKPATYLERENSLDAVRIDDKTRQASFALLIDWPLDDPRTLNAVQLKLNRYYRARKQGFHVTQFQNVNPALPVGLHVFHLPATTERGKLVLANVERSARRYGFLPVFESRLSIEGPVGGKP